MKYIHLFKFSIVFCFVLVLASCRQPGPNSTGSEYIADMAHSVAYEANTYDYYSYNRWGGAEAYHEAASPRLPVKGSIPRGQGASEDILKSNDGLYSHTGISIPTNGSVPYYYENTEEDRLRATEEILMNPLPISDANITNGKDMYNIYCAICHGTKGDGAGYLIRDDGGKYPVQPANFLLPAYASSSNGRYYHAIMYGKNLMGSHIDKLTYNERWQVIQYIRSLQAKDQGLAYNENENTYNDVDIPYATLAQDHEMETDEGEMNHNESASDHHDDGHGH